MSWFFVVDDVGGDDIVIMQLSLPPDPHNLQHTYNMQLQELNNKGARAKTLAEAILKNKSRANI